MKLKSQLTLLSYLVISIPILCSIFVFVHTYMHSPNRYLMKGSEEIQKQFNKSLSSEDIDNFEKSLKLLPVNVEATLFCISTREVLYSSMDEIQAGQYMARGEIWSFASDTSDKFFYQFTSIPSKNSDTLLITRVPQSKVSNEKKMRTSLKVLLIVIIITFISLILITYIYRDIFNGLKTIEKSSNQLAEGKLTQYIGSDNHNKNKNEFDSIMNNLEKMRKELIEMQASKNRFIMGISHDLRTPVAVIRGYSEAIKDQVITDNEEIQKSMELIEQKTEQLEDMIDTLLNCIKLNNMEIKEQLDLHSISDLIINFAKYAEITGKVFKRNVHTDIQLPKDIQIPLNEQLVQRSLGNLLSNAIRYTKKNDDITIKAYTETSDSKNHILLQIMDNGIGIEKKELDYIFNLFYRGSNSHKKDGLGVGLAVVKNIIDTHGWTISVESQRGAGSCFTITIPY